MKKKINGHYLEEYCESFTNIITSSYFEDNDSIDAHGLLKVTPSIQTNYFILQTLFFKWKHEVKKLKSPFFDYDHPDVKTSLSDFMNILSQHIKINKQDFRDLLRYSIHKTIYHLLIDPFGELKTIIKASFSQKEYNINFHENLKYIKVYTSAYKDFNALYSHKKFGSEIAPILKRIYLEKKERKKVLETLAKILPFELDLFVSKEIDTTSLTEKNPTVHDPIMSEKEFNFDNHELDDSFYPKEEEPEKISTSNKREILQKANQNTINQKAQQPKKMLNDTFKNRKEQTLADFLHKKKFVPILEMMGLNDRFMFTKILFAGNAKLFNSVIAELEKYTSFDKAAKMLVQKYSQSLNWDVKSKELNAFFKILSKRFE